MKSKRIALYTILAVFFAVSGAYAVTMEAVFADLYTRSKDSVASIRVITNEVNDKGGPVSARGAGFVWTSDGYIVSAAHMFTDVKDIEVTIARTTYKAHLVGNDVPTDIGLIKIDNVTGLKPLPVGDSDAIRIGDWVYAIGDPFGLTLTETHGIISGKHRNINNYLDEFLQIDAPINPGNSGGPLMNLKGEVVGINSMVVSDGNNTGFSVPIGLVKVIAPILKQKGKVIRASLGAELLDSNDVTSQDLDRLKLPRSYMLLKNAVVVGAVTPGSPADGALRTGDIFDSVNGKKAGSALEVARLIRYSPLGTVLAIIVNRGGDIIHTSVTLEQANGKQTFKIK